MGFRTRVAFFGTVAAMLLLLLGLIGFKEYAIRTGTTVVLQTVPVDPRSLLQGDHVVLGYEISTLPEHLSHLSRGDIVYVTLEEKADVWEAEAYDTSRPSGDKVFIKGELGRVRTLDFGIGTYFVPEGTGLIIERSRDVKVKVSVGSSGVAVIKGVIVDGKPFDPGAS